MIPADDMIQEFLYVQNAYGIEARKGKRMYHEIFSLLDEEVRGLYYNPYYLYEFALECARWYYDQGFQVVFAIHYQSKFHIHFAVNSINFRTGLKFHTSKKEKTKREQLFNWILQKHIMMRSAPMVPVMFSNGYTNAFSCLCDCNLGKTM